MAKETESDLRSIAGKVILITGAASGIGKATAKLFAAEGATVIATDRDVDAMADLAEFPSVVCRALDVTNTDQINEVLNGIQAEHGHLDVLINNAGISQPATIGTDGYLESWDKSLDVLLQGPMRLIHHSLDLLRKSSGARIINLSSTEGVGGSAHASPYTTSKHGVIGLTRSLAVELGPDGITVNAVCPGPIHTGMTEAIPEDMKEKFARRMVPLRRYGQPNEIAHAILHLALPASSYITGHALMVDGGMTIKNN